MCDSPKSVCPCSSFEPWDFMSVLYPGNCAKWVLDSCPHKDELKAEAESTRFQEYVEHDLERDPTYCPSCGSCGVDGCCAPTRCDSVRCLYGEGNILDYGCMGVQAWASMELLKQFHELIASGMSTDTVCNDVYARLTNILPLLDELYTVGNDKVKVKDIMHQIETLIKKNSDVAQRFTEHVLSQLKE